MDTTLQQARNFGYPTGHSRWVFLVGFDGALDANSFQEPLGTGHAQGMVTHILRTEEAKGTGDKD